MITNGADLWETLCLETVGVDSNGDTASKITTFGAVALSHGLVLSSYQIGRKYVAANLGAEQAEGRSAVVKQLRDWADAIEAGK